MALTPEEIHNKTFNTSKFKTGYDLDEVDDFLDQIEVTVAGLVTEVEDLRSATRGEIPASITSKLQQLTTENESLTAGLASSQSELENLRIELEYLRSQNVDLANATSQGNDAVVEQLNNQLIAAHAEIAQLQSAFAELEAHKSELEAQNSSLSEQVAQLTARIEEVSQSGAVATMSSGDASTAAVRLLEIAQRTADETLASAQIESEQVLSHASSEADRLLNETNNNIASITAQFESQQAGFERKIEELRAYEREYRGRLRSYLEGQLQELDSRRLDVELESGQTDSEQE